MGLSIHYNGKIKDTNLVPQLLEEVQDICNTLQWKYQMIDQRPAKGICFTPEECEVLFLTFSETGEICSPLLLHYNIHPATTISVKTQFAGMEVHITIIKVFQYLKAKYFSEFEMYDEGGYWQSNDESVLHGRFTRYNFLLDAVAEALESFESKEGESTESLADRLEVFLKQRFSNP